MNALDRCVGDPDRFADHWGRAPLLLRTDDLFEDVLDVDAIDDLLTSAARRPEVRLIRDGTPIRPSDYTSTVRIGGQVTDEVIDPARVADRWAEGATIVLQSVHRTWPSVGRFAAELEDLIAHTVQVNVYLTPPGAAGLAPHRDTHDVIVRQLHGSKHWDIEGLGDVTLEPGDGVYMPTGTEHSARSVDRASVHMTIGILRITYRDAIGRLLDRAGGRLAQPLPLGWTHLPDAVLADHLAAALDDARSAIADADPAELTRRERARRRTRPDHTGRLASAIRAADLDHDTVVQLRRGVTVRLADTDDGRLRLDLPDRTLRLPGVARGPIEKLATGAATRVGDLPDVDEASRVVLARRLVAEGMLEIRPQPTS